MGTRIVSGIHSVPVTVLGPLLPLLFSSVFTVNTLSPGQVACPVRIVTVKWVCLALKPSPHTTSGLVKLRGSWKWMFLSLDFLKFHVLSSRDSTYKLLLGPLTCLGKWLSCQVSTCTEGFERLLPLLSRKGLRPKAVACSSS